MSVLKRLLPSHGGEPVPDETQRPPLPVQRPRVWQRRILRHRRVILAGLGFVITVMTLSQIRPMGSPTTEVVVASHDLAAGTVLTPGDLVVKRMTRDSLPPDSQINAAPLIHHPLVTALFSGDVVRQRDVLDARLIGQIGAGLVAVPVHVTPAAAAVVERGDHVDVLAGNPNPESQAAGGGAVATDVLVLIPSLTSSPSSVLGASSTSSGADVVVIARASQAAAIASANSQTTLVLALRGTSA